MQNKKAFQPCTMVMVIAAFVCGLTIDAALAQDRKAYIIGSGDMLEIVTWKEPDFSRPQVLVRTDGNITFPLLGDLPAAGRTPVQLKQELEKRLKEFIDNPFVTVTLINPASKKIYILGEVLNTGEYPLIKNLTVLQAFALAGGFTEWASKSEIILLRRVNGKDQRMVINYKRIVQGKELDKNLALVADDTIIVP
jgi:polysaccharide export outer membrane protein